MRPRSIVAMCIALLVTFTLAVSPAVADKRIDVASPTGDGYTDRAIVMANAEAPPASRGNAPPWARSAAAVDESAPADVQCKKVQGHIREALFFESCVHQGHAYEWCLDYPIWGTLTGIFHYYGDPATEYALSVQPGALSDSWWYGTTAAMVVIETNKGDVFAHDNALFNLANFLWLAEVLVFTGGTGHYEGATGWMGILSDQSYPVGKSVTERGIVWGMICTPDEE